MTYRAIGFLCVLISALLCLVQIRHSGLGLLVLTLVFGMLGMCVIVGTAVAEEGDL